MKYKQMECLNSVCKHRWDSPTGIVDGCPKCGHLYVRWSFFDALWATPSVVVNGARVPYRHGWALV